MKKLPIGNCLKNRDFFYINPRTKKNVKSLIFSTKKKKQQHQSNSNPKSKTQFFYYFPHVAVCQNLVPL